MSLLDIRPVDPEPLPLYSRDDPDTMSIHSAAPSYVSDTPSYSSHRTPTSLLPPLSPGDEAFGLGLLPAPRYAPGFAPELRNRPVSQSNANIASWSSTRTSNNSKQYSAVARRRANQARTNTDAMLNSLSAIPPPLERSETSASASSISPTSSLHNVTTPTSASASASAYPVQVSSPSPLEDPYLVGEEAASRARRARVYREMCLRQDEVMRHEGRQWDFMAGQMGDWDERGRSWGVFKERTRGGKGMGFGRRLGWRN